MIGSAALLYGLGAAAVVAACREPFVRFMTGWLVVSAIAVFVGGRFFGHYFHQLTAPLALATRALYGSAAAVNEAGVWHAGDYALVQPWQAFLPIMRK